MLGGDRLDRLPGVPRPTANPGVAYESEASRSLDPSGTGGHDG
jgi:hypothetical protein